MASERCDGCAQEVHIAGGIASIWSFTHEPTGGMTMDFEDGSEHFLCFSCIDQLPDYPTADDVRHLEPMPEE